MPYNNMITMGLGDPQVPIEADVRKETEYNNGFVGTLEVSPGLTITGPLKKRILGYKVLRAKIKT